MRFKDTIGVSALITQLQNEMSRAIENKLRVYSLTLAQYSTLSVIEDSHSITNADLSRRCFVTPQTMNRLLTNLAKKKLVKKHADPEHGIKIYFSLTAKAEKLICDAHVAVNDIEMMMIKGLGKKEYATLEQHVRTLMNNLAS